MGIAFVANILLVILFWFPLIVFMVLIAYALHSFCRFHLPERLESYKETADVQVYEALINNHFPTFDYEHSYMEIDEEALLESGLFLEDNYDYVGKRFVYGKYNKASFLTCELHDKEKHIFSIEARWYEFKLKKNIKQEVRICEKSVVDDIYTDGLTKCELESIKFCDKYVVYATDPETVFYVIKPQVIEYLIEMEEKHEGNMIISFVNNSLYVAIKGKNSHFKLNVKKPYNDETLAKQIANINLVKEIIDGISFVDGVNPNLTDDEEDGEDINDNINKSKKK